MKKISTILLLAIVAVMLFGAVTTSASEPYDTYTYSIDGEPLRSPTAYRPESVIESIDMNIGKFSTNPKLDTDAKDVFADEDGSIYIADTGNNRIVLLDKYYKARGVIENYVDEYGNPQVFKKPAGLCVTTETKPNGSKIRYMYVCDTENYRVVVFEEQEDGSFTHDRTIVAPETPLLEQGDFKPTSIAVDKYGRIFIVAKSCYKGVIVLSGEGDFTGFIGVQKVTYSLIDMIWRKFQTAEQRATNTKNYADPYNNIAIDEDGFV